jgi:DNA-binding IclR family transcriptional regulator
MVGMRTVSAPIILDDGQILGGISVSGPATRIEGERFRKEMPELVR